MPEVNLEFLARQNERLMTQVADIRDAIDVLTAMSARHEASLLGAVQELRALYRLQARLTERVTKLENAQQ